MSAYAGTSSVYRECLVCKRPFRVWKCRLLPNRARFCSMACFSASRKAYSEALADGRLEVILARNRASASCKPGY
jgi:hypothetical protein